MLPSLSGGFGTAFLLVDQGSQPRLASAPLALAGRAGMSGAPQRPMWPPPVVVDAIPCEDGPYSVHRGSECGWWFRFWRQRLDPPEERTDGEVVRERLLVLTAGHPNLLPFGSVQPGVVPHHRPGRGCLAPPGRADRRAVLVAHQASLAGGRAVQPGPDRRWPGDGRDLGDALRTQHQGVQDKACAAIYFDLKK